MLLQDLVRVEALGVTERAQLHRLGVEGHRALDGRFALIEIVGDAVHEDRNMIEQLLRGEDVLWFDGEWIPDWSDEINVDFPNSTEGAEYEDGFMVFQHEWSNNTVLTLDFEMNVKMHKSHRMVMDNVGRLAVSFGPSIYCGEEFTLETAPQLATFDLGDEIRTTNKTCPDGSTVLQVSVLRETPSQHGELYEEFADPATKQGTMNLIPYRTWNGKGKSYMQVWLRHN